MDDVSVAPKLLSFQLLEEITNDFSEDRKVGAGSYGNVYKGEHTNGKMIAVKVLHYIPGFDDEQFEKEYHNLASLQHKNIVRLLGYCHETRREFVPYNGKMVFAEMTQRALCFEYMQNGSLDGCLTDESTGHDWRTRYAIIKGICHGLKYLHEELSPPMYHLDLKPANVLLDEHMVPKIADFGLSRLFGGEQTQMTKSPIGTHGYVPPEYIDAAIVSVKFDIYSLGVVIIKIMTGPKGYFRSAEMSPQQFVEHVHGNWKSKLQATLVHGLSEPYSEQVKICVEIAVSCVDADRHKRPSIGEIINKLNKTETAVNDIVSTMYNDDEEPIIAPPYSGTPTEPGSVQLVIKSSKKARLKRCNRKVVMLELTGGDYTTNRLGLDLVVVVDVSASMNGEKLEQLKTAIRFVILKLSPIDRLSIVTFSSSAMKLCPLRQITVASQQELQMLVDGLVAHGDGTNIMEGLQTGLKVLTDRRFSDNRAVGIMLMSAGMQSPEEAAQVNTGSVPVYTFGFGEDSDSWVLSTVACNSMGGTFSHVMEATTGHLTMAFSQCLAGLLTVLVQDLEVTVAAVGDESKVLKVTAASYPEMHNADGSVTVSFGNLYSREVRNIIVDLRLPTISRERRAEILKVTYSYSSSSSSSGRLQFVAPTETLTVWRTGGVEEETPAEIQAEEARLYIGERIKGARSLAVDRMKIEQAVHEIWRGQEMLEKVVGLAKPLLQAELQELLDLLQPQDIYWKQGRPYAFSFESSHGRQRFASRGRDIQTMRLFATPHMDRYLEQAKMFLHTAEVIKEY